MQHIIEDFGGFYRKVGQIMGTAKQMMPAPYLECFADSMDNNPPAGHWAGRTALLSTSCAAYRTGARHVVHRIGSDA